MDSRSARIVLKKRQFTTSMSEKETLMGICIYVGYATRSEKEENQGQRKPQLQERILLAFSHLGIVGNNKLISVRDPNLCI